MREGSQGFLSEFQWESLAALEALEIGDNLGAGPLLRPDELAADDSLAVDDVGLRPHVRVIQLRSLLRGVESCDEIDMVANDERRIGGAIVVDAHRENDKIGLLMMELEKGRQLLDTRHAPGSPKIEQDNLAAVAGKMNAGRAVRDGEIGRGLASLRGMRTAVARGQKG